MTFSEVYSNNEKVLSLEFFPPKKTEDLGGTLRMIEGLAQCKPNFMTVTYGAGGGTRALSHQMVRHIHQGLHIPVVQHLTCGGHSVEEIDQILDTLAREGISRILALRGDPVKGESTFKKHPQGFSCARDLVQHIHRRGDFSIAVAGYPESHREASSREDDIRYLSEKVDAGAEIIVTQLFFEANLYFDFVTRARLAGINVPIVPGVMPIANIAQLKRFTSLCGASIPAALSGKLLQLEEDPNTVIDFGIDFAVRLTEQLFLGGAPGVHFYTLNRSSQIPEILRRLKLCPRDGSGSCE